MKNKLFKFLSFMCCFIVLLSVPLSFTASAEELPFDNEWSNVLVFDEPSTGEQHIAGYTYVSNLVLSYSDLLGSMVCAWNDDIADYDIILVNEFIDLLQPIDHPFLSGYSFSELILFIDQSVEDVPAGIYVSDELYYIDHPTYFCFGQWVSSSFVPVRGGIYQFTAISNQGNTKTFEFEYSLVFPESNIVYVGYTYGLNIVYLAFIDNSDSVYLSDDSVLNADSSVSVYRLNMSQSDDGIYRVSQFTLYERTDFALPGGTSYFSLTTLNYNYSDTLTVIYEPSLLGTILSWFGVGVPALLSWFGSVFSMLTGSVILPWVLIGVAVSTTGFWIYKSKGFTRL